MAADLDELTLAKLARELAMNIRNYKLTFADFGIDETDYQQIEKIEFFRKVKEHYTVDWNAATSTADRLKIKSLAYLEQVYPALARRALNPDEPLASATGFATLLARTAGVGEAKPGPSASERFVITINLGADIEKYNKSVEINPNDVDPGTLSKGADNNGQIIDAITQVPSLQQLRSTGEGEGA